MYKVMEVTKMLGLILCTVFLVCVVLGILKVCGKINWTPPLIFLGIIFLSTLFIWMFNTPRLEYNQHVANMVDIASELYQATGIHFNINEEDSWDEAKTYALRLTTVDRRWTIMGFMGAPYMFHDGRLYSIGWYEVIKDINYYIVNS